MRTAGWIFARERREVSSTASSASIKAAAKLPGLDATASASSAATEKWTCAETRPVNGSGAMAA